MFDTRNIAKVVSMALISSAVLFLFSSSVRAQQAEEVAEAVDPAEVIAYTSEVTLTQAELDAAFNKLPPDNRLAFIRDGAKVDQLIQNLIKVKTLAKDARKAGYDQWPLIPETVAIAADKELAEDWLFQVVRDAPVVDFETIAYEDYLADPDKYRTEVTLDISHILIGNENRSLQDADQLALLLLERLKADPAIFAQLVTEYSDDPAKAVNGGRYHEMHKGQMVAPFEQAAFALTEPGQLSKPVKTKYGYHIIRLNSRSGNELPEFSAIREQVIATVTQEYYENYQAMYLRKLLSNPIVIPEGAVSIMAKRHFGEDFELAPELNETMD